jgi:type II secretory pathway pseudopilin PulG
MLVVGILGIVTAIGYFGFGAQRPRQELNRFALELRALLHGARQSALASGRQVVVMVFPDHPNDLGGTGRIVLYEDGDFDFFSSAAAVNFEGYDPAAPGPSGPRSQVLDVVDLPSRVVVGPSTGMGPGAVMPAPFGGIAIDVDCAFCTGAGRRGAVVFDPRGAVTFHDRNAAALALPVGASLSLTAPESQETRTIAIAAATGAMRTLTRSPGP